MTARDCIRFSISLSPSPRLFLWRKVSARPPCFVLFVGGRRAGDDVWSHYTRYLTNELRKEFGFMGIPLRLRVKRSEPGRNPFASS